ncbi:MAG: glycosyltransferase [Ignavibacteriota bacterium]|nr:MAG: glycosyltransferase [Chlorobiota bacterium]MBE7475184.1 glycosyltransferase [Ignavibacteriales bacterium]MBL1122150.1 glycosyltransferase [Ignavibacteriota bacterium]MCC7094501.1 glycosyltransferase [Ignavibacteriaceae bacterium]MCE7856179.1 glycosyltransferase [Ignavibacteria bacterium CHB3]MEB2297822.1 glycosyltransferase [Ignavibacteria bacterium]
MEEKDTRQEIQKQQSIGYKRYYNRRKRYHHKPNQSPHFEKLKTSFKKISIVIPLFNEEESIIPLSHEIRKAISKLNTNYEVILIDDGSTDLSLQKLKEVTKTDNRFRYFSFRKNYGKSAALHVGFKEATGDVVVTMDADLQDDPQEIPNLLKKLEEGFDLCSGWKKKRQDPFIKKMSSKFFNFVTRVISGIKLHDFNCGLKAYKKEVVENVKVYGELHRYIPVLAKWQGYTVTEIPVMHHPRRYGKTKFGISRFFKGFIDLVTVTFVTRYIKRPMHFFGFLGALAFLIGIIILAYLTVLWIQGHSLSNRPMIFLGMLLIIVGVQLFAVGLLGEVIVHNSMDDREYVIKDKS